jgi:hypothetical protein
MKVTKRQLKRIIREEKTKLLREMSDRANRLTVYFDIIGEKPMIIIRESGYEYDLTYYAEDELDVFLGDFLTDHGQEMPPGQPIGDAFGIGIDGMPIEQAWDAIRDEMLRMYDGNVPLTGNDGRVY